MQSNEFIINSTRRIALSNYMLIKHLKITERILVDQKFPINNSSEDNVTENKKKVIQNGFKLYIDRTWDQNSPRKMNDSNLRICLLMSVYKTFEFVIRMQCYSKTDIFATLEKTRNYMFINYNDFIDMHILIEDLMKYNMNPREYILDASYGKIIVPYLKDCNITKQDRCMQKCYELDLCTVL